MGCCFHMSAKTTNLVEPPTKGKRRGRRTIANALKAPPPSSSPASAESRPDGKTVHPPLCWDAGALASGCRLLHHAQPSTGALLPVFQRGAPAALQPSSQVKTLSLNSSLWLLPPLSREGGGCIHPLQPTAHSVRCIFFCYYCCRISQERLIESTNFLHLLIFSPSRWR